jgi:hypothetical protein
LPTPFSAEGFRDNAGIRLTFEIIRASKHGL